MAANVDLEAFRKECQARIAQRLLAKMPQVRGGVVDKDNVDDLTWAGITRRRVAIVGAGPVGLWAAMLLAQKYRWTDGKGCARLRPDAPEVTVFEARSMENHCTRTDIRIALSSSTRSMLDQQTKSRSFTSGMPVAEIEDTFLRRWKKVAGHEAKIGYGTQISDPAELAQSGQFDCILWSAGRRSLNDALRRDLGCEVRIGDSQRVVVFQVQELQGPDAWQLGSLDLSGAAQQAGRFPGLRVMLRPGFEGACACWLWVFGLSNEVLESFVLKGTSIAPRDSLAEAFEDLVGTTAQALRPALDALQLRIKPMAVTCRFVEASYWSADHAVCQLSVCDQLVPFILLGDALGGKPFYTGSTLNRHLWDVATLIEEVEFAYDGGPLEAGRFAMYERRYQECLRRIPEFQRPRSIILQALPKPMPVPRKDETRPCEPKVLSLPALPTDGRLCKSCG
ncbi:unnamed protein product [Symbiodinium pilosum]|uniref:FAD-binding domain-containing protein n=1 Tax=Symbiodinium pilosum TaxID=2952 RepID=A0A812MHZ1_SYMPI|nr:unnamed protein product [Symbiodinium pilosum]